MGDYIGEYYKCFSKGDTGGLDYSSYKGVCF